jgi:hypothetical protein
MNAVQYLHSPSALSARQFVELTSKEYPVTQRDISHTFRISQDEKELAERLRATLGERSFGSLLRRLLVEEGKRRVSEQPRVKSAA